jgi:hypothetical protein
MAYQLWTSLETGTRRVGTTFKEIRSLFDKGITAESIFEPLKSCNLSENAITVKSELKRLGFDVAGVMKSKSGPNIGYVKQKDLDSGIVKDHLLEFDIELLISDSTPIPELFDLLSDRDYLFILNKSQIKGIITKADLNKPIVRIYLFGLVSLLEMHLGFWLRNYYPEESWKKVLKDKRLEKAKKLYDIRKARNNEIDLFDCLQLCDKKVLFVDKKALVDEFSIKSKTQGKNKLKMIQKLRNSLAHSQKDILSVINIQELAELVTWTEEFIQKSDMKVKERAETEGSI